MNKATTINQKTCALNARVLGVVLTFGLLVLVPTAYAQSKKTAPARGKAFATPQEAVDLLIASADVYDETQLTEILGPNSWDIIHTGEPVRDREDAKAFAD